MKRRAIIGASILLLIATPLITGAVAATSDTQTSLFISLDTYWEHKNNGDAFVVRADVKNIGDYAAIDIVINLKNVPSDWNTTPWHMNIPILAPGQTKTCYFIIERGPTNSTIYATAEALNAPLVQSNRIAIPISLYVIAGFAVVCSVLIIQVHRQRKKNNTQ